MACIQKVVRKKGNVYRVYIKKVGFKRVSKTFDSKRLAVQFVNSIESDRNKLLAYTQSVFADLDKAIAYAEAGDVRKGQIELYNTSQRALEGQPKSMCEFGTMYKKEGYWIVQSDKDASDWWLKSAEMGYAPCQFNIGAAYLIGSGIEKDLSKAKYWLQRAIDSSYDEFSESARVLYAIHELEKY